MEAIVAVFSDWGIGSEGTQQVVLKADRAHFRELTQGAAVIVGRRTLADFPGGSPLIILSIRGTPAGKNEWLSNLNIADSKADAGKKKKGSMRTRMMKRQAEYQKQLSQELENRKTKLFQEKYA